MQQIKLVIQK